MEPLDGGLFAGRRYQGLAVLLCLVLAIAMILNNQMSGEAMWFWYAAVFRQGAKLYADLHFALQPIFVLETAAWTGLFGNKLAVYEIPGLLHALFLATALFLVLRESRWPDLQKAVVLLSTFVLTVAGHSYRFDDYHVLTEALVIYAVWILLLMGRRPELLSVRRELTLATALGVVCGLTIMTRITDGVALAAAAAVCLLFLARHRKITALGFFLVATTLVVVVVVKLTGDTFAAWSSSSIFRAAANKGGTGSIAAAPLGMVLNSVTWLSHTKRLDLSMVLLLAIAAYLGGQRKDGLHRVVAVQVSVMLGLLFLWVLGNRLYPSDGFFFEYVAVSTSLGMYVLAVVAIVRGVRAWRGEGTWDARQVLFLIPICEWASYAAASSAEPILNYYAPPAVVLLLLPVLRPFGRFASWAEPTVLTLLVLLSVNGILGKIAMPYQWQNYQFPTMFTQREWIKHPVYGPMYVDRWNLDFSRRLCAEIGADPGKTHPQMLSLPYPYPNYFCDTPPWHNYVQTFFDTTTRATVEHLIVELEANPPEWIVYQRQINILVGAERLYNHRRPLAQRDLDKMIMEKLNSGEWTLVDRSGYLRPGYWKNWDETDWYVIRTRPTGPDSSHPPIPSAMATVEGSSL